MLPQFITYHETSPTAVLNTPSYQTEHGETANDGCKSTRLGNGPTGRPESPDHDMVYSVTFVKFDIRLEAIYDFLGNGSQ